MKTKLRVHTELASVTPPPRDSVSARQTASSSENPLKPEVFRQKSEGQQADLRGHSHRGHTQYLDAGGGKTWIPALPLPLTSWVVGK